MTQTEQEEKEIVCEKRTGHEWDFRAVRIGNSCIRIESDRPKLWLTSYDLAALLIGAENGDIWDAIDRLRYVVKKAKKD